MKAKHKAKKKVSKKKKIAKRSSVAALNRDSAISYLFGYGARGDEYQCAGLLNMIEAVFYSEEESFEPDYLEQLIDRAADN